MSTTPIPSTLSWPSVQDSSSLTLVSANVASVTDVHNQARSANVVTVIFPSLGHLHLATARLPVVCLQTANPPTARWLSLPLFNLRPPDTPLVNMRPLSLLPLSLHLLKLYPLGLTPLNMRTVASTTPDSPLPSQCQFVLDMLRRYHRGRTTSTQKSHFRVTRYSRR